MDWRRFRLGFLAHCALVFASCGSNDCSKNKPCPVVPPAPTPAPTPVPLPVVPPLPAPVPKPEPAPEPKPDVTPEPKPVPQEDVTPAGFLSEAQVIDAFLKMTNAPVELPASDSASEERSAAAKASEGLMVNLRPVSYDVRSTGLGTSGRISRDLRAFDTPIKNQGQRGTCTAFGTVGAIENVAKRKSGKVLDVSEEQLWDSYRVPQTVGAVKGASRLWLVPEALYPYARRAYHKNVPPEEGVLHAAKFAQIEPSLSAIAQSVVDERSPLVFAFEVSRAFVSGQAAVNPFDRSVVGGHAVAVVGVVKSEKLNAHFGGGYFIIKNSWAATQGDKGYNYMPFSYCQTHTCYEAFQPDYDALEVR